MKTEAQLLISTVMNKARAQIKKCEEAVNDLFGEGNDKKLSIDLSNVNIDSDLDKTPVILTYFFYQHKFEKRDAPSNVKPLTFERK